jgi:protein O-mannosyl-transferase
VQQLARRRLVHAALGIALLGAVVWIYRALAGAALTNWDDDRFLTYNPLFQAGGWTYIRAAFTQLQFEAYQPLHLISYLPDHYLWPDWPPGFHLLNLGLFATDLVLIWRLVRRHASDRAAFAAIAVLALHPLCVEPVAWVTDRKDLLMVLWFVLALGREDGRTGARPHGGGLVLHVCALLTKSSSVCFPIVLFAWLVWVQGRPVREAICRSAGYAAAALAVSVLVFAVWQDHGMIAHDAIASRPIDVAATLAIYVAHAFWPVDLGPAYPNDPPHPVAAAVLCAAAALALAAGWRWLPARARYAVVAGGGALLPVSNLVPMSLRFADRYLFVVLAVLVLPAASALDALIARAQPHGRRAAAAIALAVIAICGLEARITARVAPSWRSSRALWAHAVDAQPGAFLARLKYAETLGDERQWPAAKAQLWAARQLHPHSLLPPQHLFQLDAEQAELAGALPTGTAARWLDASERALGDRGAHEQLAVEVDRSACRTCSEALVVLGLTAWPRPDAELLAAARQALDQGAPDRARLYLGQVRDRTAPDFAPLEQRARRPPAAATSGEP